MAKRKLPIGIQNFREVRQENCYYVDNTAYLWWLLEEGKHYFLSRPRRFGKSLFLDTCKELLDGNKALFTGLFIHDRWDWSARHPVLRLSFASGYFQAPGELRTEVADRLGDMEAEAGIVARHAGAATRLRHLIETLHRKTDQRVALLIDEYDKPVLDALETPEVARSNRDFLRGLYAVVKDSDAHIRFSLFEFKVVELAPEGAAMAQLKSRRYADKYRHLGAPIHLVAVEFSSADRNVAAFDVERA